MFPLNYDKSPFVRVHGDHAAWRGWEAILAHLNRALASARAVGGCTVAVECYPGVHEEEVSRALISGLRPERMLFSRDAFLPEPEIERLAAPFLGGDDPLFGYLSPLPLERFLDSHAVREMQSRAAGKSGLTVICGTGASLCVQADVLIYADMPRWEGQLRQRRGEADNLGVRNRGEKASLQYKRSFFLDWRVCDRWKRETLERWDYLLDTTVPDDPKMVGGAALRDGLAQTARQPFRVVPFFDPAPWGGQWMREVCGLGDAPNYGWCFDCVPEENSLRLDFGGAVTEIPALDLVFCEPRALLGDAVFGLFGHEFPIRFDFLDTMGGGNLSLQVHPLTEYIRAQFGMFYTQDESYYILDAAPGASVYLGMQTGASPEQLFAALEAAQAGAAPFDPEAFVNRWPARKHDHFLIPAGTIHCSGADSMVLEISATPYIFTFKLWDWGRLGLDGLPRPINLGHGRSNLQADRDTEWTRRNLINPIATLGQGAGWREERTGLHALEYIETRRHWFTEAVPHDTRGTVNVLNLVQGDSAIVESPDDAFAPFPVHYAETFIVPAAVGPYIVRPGASAEGQECATMKAYVRSFP